METSAGQRILQLGSELVSANAKIEELTQSALQMHQCIASLKSARDELLDIAERYANTYLLDEYDSSEYCVDENEHIMVRELFSAIAKAMQVQP